jgi:hypothetical protein
VCVETGGELEQRRPDGPHVGLFVDEVPTTLGLLGRHEPYGSEDGVQAGDSRLLRLGLAPEPEVQHLELALARSEQVLWLDVPVEHAPRVGRLDGIANPMADFQNGGDREPTAHKESFLFERLPLQELGHQERAVVVGHAVAEDAHDIGVAYPVDERSLSTKAGHESRVIQVAPVEHLDGDADSVRLARHEHGARPTFAEQPFHLPLSREDGARTWVWRDGVHGRGVSGARHSAQGACPSLPGV